MTGQAHIDYSMCALLALGGGYAYFKKGSIPSLVSVW